MDDHRTAAMIEATALTRAGRLAEATELIRRTLSAPVPPAPPTGAPARDVLHEPGSRAERDPRSAAGGMRGRLRDRLGRAARDTAARLPGVGQAGVALPGLAAPTTPDHALPGETLARTHRGPHGERPYTLYVPTTGVGPRPLVVMLHGGTQTAAAFAAATRMSELAEEHGFLVAHPEQVTSANAMRYWNWFSPGDQHRSGESALLAAIVSEVAGAHEVDRDRVYVAGFSAGGAMAAVLGAAYPEVFAAVGVHSGLPHGCAHDLPSAFTAMRDAPRVRPLDRPVPVIAFHGDADTTVAAGNATRVVEQFAQGPADGDTLVERGPGRPAARTVVRRHGAVVAERWIVHGAGHAWSGGVAGGSFADPAGPDASVEMVRFFAEHPRGGR